MTQPTTYNPASVTVTPNIPVAPQAVPTAPIPASEYKELVCLDPNDPFDSALIPIVLTNRRKRADYAKDGDPFSNFRDTSSLFGLEGFGPVEAALFNLFQKVTRLRSLRMNGRMKETQNEAVIDTYLDLAVYAVIVYALAMEQEKQSV